MLSVVVPSMNLTGIVSRNALKFSPFRTVIVTLVGIESALTVRPLGKVKLCD